VLAIHGEDDEFGSAAHPHRISAGRGQAVLLSGMGHNPHREAEGTVLELIRTFLQDLPRP
jgi:pimeloyl-ACP methyl ester carboxylesterase